MKKIKILALSLLIALSACKKEELNYPLQTAPQNTRISIDSPMTVTPNPDEIIPEEVATANIDSIPDNDFDINDFVGTETYRTSYAEEKRNGDYYAFYEEDTSPMRFVVSNKMIVVKGRLVDKMINCIGVPEMEIHIYHMTASSIDDGIEGFLYTVNYVFNTGEGLKSCLGNLKIWIVDEKIVSMRISNERTPNSRFSFVTKPLDTPTEQQ